LSLAPGRPFTRTACILLIGTVGSTPLAAQLLEDAPTVMIPPEPPLTTARSIVTRDRQTPVAERALPAFSAQGITVGAFDVFPGLSVGGLYTSNIYADNRRRHSDVAVVVRP